MLKQFRLADDDRKKIRELLVDIVRDPKNLEENSFLDRAALIAQELPIRIRETLYEFKLRESSDALLITNNPVSWEDVGRTPSSHWRPGESRPLNLPQIMHGLYSSLLGEPFGFETQQYGRIFNDLIPIPNMQPNSSSGMGILGCTRKTVPSRSCRTISGSCASAMNNTPSRRFPPYAAPKSLRPFGAFCVRSGSST